MDATLSEGDHGQHVLRLQRALRDLGYDVGAIDGRFGSRTRVALTQYQTDYGMASIVDTGVCGDTTWASLRNQLASWQAGGKPQPARGQSPRR